MAVFSVLTTITLTKDKSVSAEMKADGQNPHIAEASQLKVTHSTRHRCQDQDTMNNPAGLLFFSTVFISPPHRHTRFVLFFCAYSHLSLDVFFFSLRVRARESCKAFSDATTVKWWTPNKRIDERERDIPNAAWEKRENSIEETEEGYVDVIWEMASGMFRLWSRALQR